MKHDARKRIMTYFLNDGSKCFFFFILNQKLRKVLFSEEKNNVESKNIEKEKAYFITIWEVYRFSFSPSTFA